MHDYDNKESILKYAIDIIVHGDDWEQESYMAQIKVDEAFLAANGVALHLLPYTEGISTSGLIKKIKES